MDYSTLNVMAKACLYGLLLLPVHQLYQMTTTANYDKASVVYLSNSLVHTNALNMLLSVRCPQTRSRSLCDPYAIEDSSVKISWRKA